MQEHRSLKRDKTVEGMQGHTEGFYTLPVPVPEPILERTGMIKKIGFGT